MNGINLSISQGGLTQQYRPKEPQTQTNLSTGQFADTPQHAPPIHPPLGIDEIRDTTPHNAPVSSNTWWDFATQVVDSVSTMFSPGIAEAPTPQIRYHGGGMSALGRLGMLIAFFGSTVAGTQHLRGNEAPNTVFPEWKTHNYFTETKHLEGTSEWFRIAHIADGNSTSARFNLNGHHGHNHWDVNIQLWAGINAVSSCWNTANEAHIAQGFRFTTGPEEHLFLEIQGTPQPDTTILGATATGMGFNPIQFIPATDSVVLRHYDFATLGGLKNGCFSDQISGGTGHVTMVDGNPVITVKEAGLGIFQSDPQYPLDVSGTARATAFMGDGQALTYLNASELHSGQIPSDRVWGNYTGITAVGELGELVVGGNLGIGTTTPGVSLEVAGIGRFTSSSGFSIGSDPGHNRLEYSASGFSRISALSSGNAYLGLSAKSLSIGTTYGSISPPGNGAIFEGNVGIGVSNPTYTLHVLGTFFASTSVGFPGGSIFSDASAVNLQADSTATSGLKLGTSGSTPVVLYTNGAEKVRVDAAGKVGVGTPSPDALLSVNGVASFGAGTAALPSIAAFGDLDTGMFFPAADTLGFSTNGAQRAQISNTLFTIMNTLRLSSVASGTGTALVVDSNGDVFKSSGTTAIAFAAGSAGNPSIIPNGDTNTGFFFPASDTIAISTGGQERWRTDGNGYILMGLTEARSRFGGVNADGIAPVFQIEGETTHRASFSIVQNANSATVNAEIVLGKQRSGFTTSNTIVQNNDLLGRISFMGGDSVNFIRAAAIFAEVDGTPGVDDMPGRLILCTTADGSKICTEHLRINNAGQLLIGTASPISTNAKVNIQAKGTTASGYTAASNAFFVIDSGTATNGVLNLVGGGDLAMTWSNSNGAYDAFIEYLGATRAMRFATAGVERVRVDGSGKVGVGANTPQRQVHIKTNDPSSGGAVLRLDNSGTASNEVGLEFYSSHSGETGASRAGRIYSKFDGASYTDARLTFQTMNTGDSLVDTLTLKNGKVGIGTSSPTERLEVIGNILATALFFRSSGTSITTDQTTATYMSFSLTNAEIMRLARISTNAGQLRVAQYSTSGTAAGQPAYSFLSDTDTGLFSPGSDSLGFSTGGVEVGRFASNGNFGLGTTIPDARLSVNGVASFGAGTAALPSIAAFGDLDTGISFPAADTIAWSTGGSERVRMDSSGNVGIGFSSTMSNKVNIATSTNDLSSGAHLAFYNAGILKARIFSYNTATGESGDGLYFESRDVSTTNGKIVFRTVTAGGVATERMRISSSGQVGIGATDPAASAKLDVSSTTQGFLPPRMTAAQRDAIDSPALGLTIYTTDTDQLCFKRVAGWYCIP